ncbi:MAG: PKD domain-containing protein [Alphaproteobacteria bacterium]
MTKCDKGSAGGGKVGGYLAGTAITPARGLVDDAMTRYGAIGSVLKTSALKTTAGAIALALLMAGPASAASVESQPGTAPFAPPGAAVANARADLDGDRIEDALGARIAASRAGERFDVIVMFEGPDAVGRGRAAAGPFAVTREFSVINGFQAQLTGPQIGGLSRAPGLFRISGNGTVTAHDIPSNDDMGATDARMEFVDSELNAIDGSGVTICVIDTGIDIPHELFATKGMDSTRFFDATSNLTAPYDDNGHGSHVSGIAAGNGATAMAMEAIGVAPGASLKVAKVLEANGSGSNAQVLAGIDWCANEPDVDILSMSLGGDPTDGTDAMSVAVNCVADPSPGTCSGNNDPKIVVVSAGNSGAFWSTIGTPGVAELAITVGSIAEWSGNPATNWQDDGLYLNIFSSRGPVIDEFGNPRIKPDITGPGSNVLSAYVFDQNTANEYGIASGTSMSAPFVTGVIALMLQANPDLGIVDPLDSEGLLPHEKVRSILTSTAKDLGAPGPDNEYGHGVIDAYAAVAMADPATSSYVRTDYPGYTRLPGLNVANSGNWFWPFTVTADMLVIPVTPIAGTVTVDGTFEQTCAVPDPLDPSQCWFWNPGVWTPDLELILEEELPPGSDTWFQVAEGSGEVTLSECPARPVPGCGGVGRAEVVHFIPQDVGSYRFRVFPADDASNQGVGGDFDFEVSMGAPVPAGNAAPVAGFSVTTSVGSLIATFTDTSTDDSGPIASRSWDFGDESPPLPTELTPSHTYAAAGIYTVTLTVTDNDGETDTDSQSVTVPKPLNVPPTAGFGVSVSDLEATFTDTSTDSNGTVDSWSWDFGGAGSGGPVDTQNPIFTYDSAGTYQVTLTVTDNDGAPDSFGLIDVTVTDPPPNETPVASFTVDTAPICGSMFFDNQCQFTDTSTDANGVEDIVSWNWNFGGGSFVSCLPCDGPGQKMLVRFPAGGDDPVTVILTVIDNAGAPRSTSMTLPISDPLAAPVSVHIADLDDKSALAARNRWNAEVLVEVRDDNDMPVFGAKVDGDWISGTNGTGTCDTGTNGQCTITKSNLKGGVSLVTFSVASIAITGLDYMATENTDPDGDSTGTLIHLPKPGTVPTPPLTAAFSVDNDPCGGMFFPNTCMFTDTSIDGPDGNIVLWSWDIGDGNPQQSTIPGNQILVEFPANGPNPVTVTLTVTDGTDATDTTSMTLEISDPQTVGDPPVAGFSFTTTDLTADFTDGSSDTEGPIAAWSWDFGDGNSSTVQNPSHTYGSTGSYDVTLTVTDSNDNSTTSAAQSVTVMAPPPPPGSLTLISASAYKVKGVQHVALEWTGANGADVVIYRNGNQLTLDPSDPVNDGNYDDNINQKGGGSYTYQVCIPGDPEGCSNSAPAVF